MKIFAYLLIDSIFVSLILVGMTTKEEIIDLAHDLIKDKGYNGFSFKDISKSIGIKTSSIHYHFPYKSDLGISVIKEQIKKLGYLKETLRDQDPNTKLEGFFQIYSQIKTNNTVCLVGSLATDFNTIEDKVQVELKKLAGQILDWVTEILEEGSAQKVFKFHVPARTKAMMVISNMLAMVQLSRLTNDADFETVKDAIKMELTQEEI